LNCGNGAAELADNRAMTSRLDSPSDSDSTASASASDFGSEGLSSSHFARLVAEQTPLVERIASNLARRLPTSVERDDLVQDGMLGLIEALLRWTRARTGSHFENYVAKRAHGAMLDGLRAGDPASRDLRRTMRAAEQAIQRLGHTLGRAPLESEVAQALGLELADYQRKLQDVQGYMLLSLDDLDVVDNTQSYLDYCAVSHVDPLRMLERAAVRQALIDASLELPEQKKAVLRLYYEGELTMREIGQRLEISEARVSQLHSHAIAQLRAGILGELPATALLKPRTKERPSAAAA
jgi:RNA polymerase sigma factor FliA